MKLQAAIRAMIDTIAKKMTRRSVGEYFADKVLVGAFSSKVLWSAFLICSQFIGG